MEYSELALFQGITNGEVDAMIHCFHMRQARYESGQTICTYGEGGGEVGVLIRGHAALVRYDYAGTRTILEQIGTGGVFGEVLAFTPELGDCVEVVSGGESEALFMEYGHLMKRCENACAHHSRLVQNMFQLVTEPPGGGPQPPQHPGKVAVLFPHLPSGSGLGQLSASLYPQCPGRLHQHRPQRHDAGAEKNAGGRPDIHERTTRHSAGGYLRYSTFLMPPFCVSASSRS